MTKPRMADQHGTSTLLSRFLLLFSWGRVRSERRTHIWRCGRDVCPPPPSTSPGTSAPRRPLLPVPSGLQIGVSSDLENPLRVLPETTQFLARQGRILRAPGLIYSQRVSNRPWPCLREFPERFFISAGFTASSWEINEPADAAEAVDGDICKRRIQRRSCDARG